MTSPFLPSPFMYGDIPGGGNVATIVVANTAPTVSQNQQQVGSFWLVPEPAGSGNLYYLAGFLLGVPQWELISSSSGTVISVVGTAAQITANTAAGVVTLSIPATFIAPGSIAATTTVTAGTGITATTGNITASTGNISATLGSVAAGTTVTGGTGLIATTGNVTISAVGSGLVTTPTVASGAAAGTVTANGRIVSVTFTGVSIASGASQAFTTANSSITGAGTVLKISWTGATAGSALSIQSVVNSAGQSVITMTNGTSATMVTSVANITFTYFVLN